MRGVIGGACLLGFLLGCARGGAPSDPPEAARVTIVEDFDEGLDRWAPLAGRRWRVVEGEGDQPNALALIDAGEQRGGVRRPGAYALLKGHRFESFTLELEARTLEPDHKRGRDVCLIFGYRDGTHFYYAHLSDDADGKAHNVIMTVAGDERRTIHRPAEPEPRLSRHWRKIRLTLDAEGHVAVYMVDMAEPLMTARLDSAATGMIALGAFNDRASFRNVRITGRTRQ